MLLEAYIIFVWIAEDTENADFKMSSCQIMTSIWGLKPVYKGVKVVNTKNFTHR